MICINVLHFQAGLGSVRTEISYNIHLNIFSYKRICGEFNISSNVLSLPYTVMDTFVVYISKHELWEIYLS